MKEVNAPSGFANTELNGSRGLLLIQYRGNRSVTLYLLTGPRAGCEWQFHKDHVRDARG
jgi:hypothetical protein